MFYFDALMGLALVVIVFAAGVSLVDLLLDAPLRARGPHDPAPAAGPHPSRALLALSLAAALVANVDVIRIVRVLTVHPDARALVARLAAGNTPPVIPPPPMIPPPAMPLPEGTRPPPPIEPVPPPVDVARPGFNALTPLLPSAVFSEWQRDNLAELASAGLPLGWARAPLSICQDARGQRSVTLWDEPCKGGLAAGGTLLLWLSRALGLAMGAGLIAQVSALWGAALRARLRPPAPRDRTSAAP